MRLLDLFCGAGGASMGYHRAGFEVVGVDHRPQPRYPFEFVQADAMTYPLHGFDAIHASPPCQDHSQLSRNYGAPQHGTGYLLEATLQRLAGSGRPWVVENVVGARIPGAFVLCGGSFGLGVSGLDLNRHRQFGVNFPILAPPCQHRPGQTIGVYGNGTNAWHRAKLGRNLKAAELREAMGIDWMNRAELSPGGPAPLHRVRRRAAACPPRRGPLRSLWPGPSRSQVPRLRRPARPAAGRMSDPARWTDDQLRLAVELAWRSGRAWAPPDAAAWLRWLERGPRPVAPAVGWEERVAARSVREDGRPDYPGGPVDWDTGLPAE